MADELTSDQTETARRILTCHAKVCESIDEFIKFRNDVKALINVPDDVIVEVTAAHTRRVTATVNNSKNGRQQKRKREKALILLIVSTLVFFWSLLIAAVMNIDGGSRSSHVVQPQPPKVLEIIRETASASSINSTIGQDDTLAKSDIDSLGVSLSDDTPVVRAMEAKLNPLKEYATSVMFDPKLDEGLYLVGAGVRKKSIIKIYAVGMYGSAEVLNNVSPSTLSDVSRTFSPSSPVVSFVLEMVYSVGAEKMADAIAESVKPRYSGPTSDINALESLIIEGVNSIGGQASKGTIFRFDCSEEGVRVSVNGVSQGSASFGDIGSAFVDVFMDENAVSPTLFDSCIDTWSSDEAKALAASLLKFSKVDAKAEIDNDTSEYVRAESTAQATEEGEELKAAESKLKSIKEYATSISFSPKLGERLYLVGAGVRKKSVIKIYGVAMYSSAAVLNDAAVSSSSESLQAAARTFDESTTSTVFVLDMVYTLGAVKIASAIADGVKPRYGGSSSDVSALESLIVDGVNSIGGQAAKGTMFRFDCSSEGVTVTVDGTPRGTANFEGLGSAFVDVFMDENAVSPTLVESCLNTWSSDDARALAASLLELSKVDAETETDTDSGNAEEMVEDFIGKRVAIEAQLKQIQEYATSVTFDPKLNEGLYLVGAGVRKKSIIKVYAVGMYSSVAVLNNVSPSTLGNAVRMFSPSSPIVSFVLEMVYSVGAEKMADAIAESVKPRYSGPPSDVNALESLIIKGVNNIGGQASKGTIFRFDCSEEGVSVSVNGVSQGSASFVGIGSAFVDVFMDENAVSPTLFDSCIDTWSSDEAKALATSLLVVSTVVIEKDEVEDAESSKEEQNINMEGEEQAPQEANDLVPMYEKDAIDIDSEEQPSTVVSTQKDEIKRTASDLAAQKLHTLAELMDNNTYKEEDEPKLPVIKPMRKVLKKLFPVF